MENELGNWAEAKGMKAAVLGTEILPNIRDRLDGLAADGSLDAGFVRSSLCAFRDLAPGTSAASRMPYLVLLALRRPAHGVSFRYPEGIPDLILPPTYVKYRATGEAVAAAFRAAFGLKPGRAELVSAPLKSLAAAAGLIRYGRNNIGYIPGWGSCFQLVGILTDQPFGECPEPVPIEGQLLERCRNCRACLLACPTGAIPEDRLLLRAELCYVLFSESEAPIPDTMPVPKPLCLVGCLSCQKTCPENGGRIPTEHSGVEFSAAETEAMLSDPEEKKEGAWTAVREKFAELGVSEDTRIFARNLRFMKKHGFGEAECLPAPGRR